MQPQNVSLQKNAGFFLHLYFLFHKCQTNWFCFVVYLFEGVIFLLLLFLKLEH